MYMRTGNKMKKKRLVTVLIALLALALIYLVIFNNMKDKTYDQRLHDEQLTEVDFYSMQKYCSENSAAVMAVLKAGSSKELEALLIEPKGIDEVMAFAEWKKADFENAVSMGAGSLTPAPDGNGRMDISERFIVTVKDDKYVLFIETMTSRWGINNDGVSAVGVTTYGHFDALDYSWSGEPDDQSALAGELWWNKQN